MQKIESRDHPYVKHLCKLIKDNAYREQMQSAVVMGEQLTTELLPFAKMVFATEKQPFEYVHISSRVADKVGASIFAELPLPKPELKTTIDRLLALDAVSDPGNLGTLARTALALGWDGIFLLPGCSDPFNDKAIRASKGAFFKLPFLKGSWADFDKIANQHQLMPLAADLRGEPPEIFAKNRCFLILGSEGQGISKEGLERGRKISIPIRQEMESLNVSAAGAILMYLLEGS